MRGPPSLKAEPELIDASTTITAGRELSNARFRFSELVRDIVTMGGGTALAALFNTLLIFLIPRVLSVEDFGYWRLFLLYGGYVGFLHLGFADGALLRWAGRPLNDFRNEFRPAVKYLLWQHLAILVAVCGIVKVLPGPLRFVAIAVAIFAPLFNITATLQFGLQGAREFRPVAISTVASPALFFLSVLLFGSMRRLDFREITGIYLLAWCAPLVFLLLWTRPLSTTLHKTASRDLAKACLLSGWPITIASTGVNLIQSADRLAVSWSTSIENFAVYSLAASLMAVPMLLVQVCSKVFFSHLAGVSRQRREQIYAVSELTFLAAWAILLPCYFALGIFVGHFLPTYLPSLIYARVLLLGIPFLAAIQILQMSLAFLNGMQKQFLASTLIVLAVSLGVMSLAAFYRGSARSIAGMQVLILGACWMLNEWTLRSLTAKRSGDSIKFLGLYILIGISYWITTAPGMNVAVAVSLYYLILSVILALGCKEQWRLWFVEIRGRRRAVAQGR